MIADGDPDGVTTPRELFRHGLYEAALEACWRTLAEKPDDAETQGLLARVLIERGRPTVAALTLERLIAQRPGDAELHTLLGRAHRLMGDVAGAERALVRALELSPRDGHARAELARVRAADGRAEPALLELEEALRVDAGDGELHFVHAELLLSRGRLDEARSAFERARLLEPILATRHQALAQMHRALGDEPTATSALEAGLALMPGDPELTHLVAAAKGESASARASDAYIVRYFDRFAHTFDRVLRSNLQYRGPELLVALLEPLVRHRKGQLEVLDAGCGTGLCGPLLRPLARRLTGIDLSAEMLRRAERLGLYEELVNGEITDYLQEHPGRFDVVVLADVLMYFGDLHPILRCLADALRPGGVAAFSVELPADGGKVLQTSGRWAHSTREVANAAAAAGLRLAYEEVDLRLEDREPVRGLVATGTATK